MPKTSISFVICMICFSLGCAVEAHPLNEQKQCWRSQKDLVGFYMPTIGGCHEGDAAVEDEDGKCWYFIGGCIPDDLKYTSKCEKYDATFCK